ncbi:MAG: 50S ribosomal protein L6 [Akkermansia sp.]|nr:50S ribosomal protein L6 [Akkermansia sp.]
MSRVGKKAIAIPAGVTVAIDGCNISVKGGKGELAWTMPSCISASVEGSTLTVSRASEDRQCRALHGTSRSLIANMVEGVSKGFAKSLEIVGVGLKAAVKGKNLDLALGKSHPILHPIPDGITVTVTDNTKVKVEGIDKQLVGQFAAEVRGYYPPEPYKGKGIHYVGEYIRRKEGKSVGK